MLLRFPFQVLLRLLRKPENGNLWWSRISEQLVEELVKLPTLASQRKRAGTQCASKPQSRSNTFRRTDATTITAPLSANRTRELSLGSRSDFTSIGYLKEEPRSGGVD